MFHLKVKHTVGQNGLIFNKLITTKKSCQNLTASISCELERSRTPNLLIRSQVLYPVELLVQLNKFLEFLFLDPGALAS